mmetsp:Transcript_11823/g.21847  ORF Transcript_11823/g.21847 Transcript_11823/m.21847 type:complete len:355 (-) Transcript_11823:288-1352(-)
MSGEAMYIASVVGTYWVVSISMVYLNKLLMSDGLSIPAPLFVTWYQCVFTVLICWTAGLCGQRARSSSATQYTPVSVNDNGGVSAPANPPKPSFFAQFPKAEYVMVQAKQIFPLSCVFVGMITFNNLCLRHVEVSFYNVARSLTIVFNVFFSRIFLGIPTSCKTMVCLGIVISGFVMGTHGELNFSLIGTVSGILSSLFVSLNSIFTKKVLPVVDDNHWKLTFYNNVNATFLFIPLIIYFEGDVLMQSQERLTSAAFWSAMSVAGFFGFSIGIVTVLQIKATSPLTHNISGTAKAAVQSLMAFYLWGNDWTVLGVLGIFTVLGGSLLYTFVRMSENAQNVQNAPPPQQEMSSKV